MEGKIIVWFINQEQLEKGQVYLLNNTMKSSVMMEYPKYHVQSLHLAENKILVGTRNGDIYEIMYHKDKVKG